MAQVDVQWPSEDEDFDATSDKVSTVATADNEEAPSITPEPAAEEAKPAEDEANSEAVVPEADPAPEVEEPRPELAPILPSEPIEPKVRTGKGGMSQWSGRTLLEIVLCIAVVALALWAWTLQGDKNDLEKRVAALNNNPQIAVQKQTQDLLNKVGQLIQLPTDETPTIANVSDAAQAKKQSAFFNNAQNGDKVLMYVKAGEAILYRPSTNKIVLVAPLTFTNNTSSTSSSSSSNKTSSTTSTKSSTTTGH